MTGKVIAGGRTCGSTTKQTDAPCKNAAGKGTDHPGWGRCKFHGGSTPAGGKAAALEEAESMRARSMIGSPVEDLTPHEILDREMRAAAGFSEALRQMIVALGPSDIETAGPLLRLYEAAARQVVTFSKTMLDAHVDERQLQLAEAQGRLVFEIINAVFDDRRLTMDPLTRQAARGIVVEKIRAIGSGAAADGIADAELVEEPPLDG